MGSKRVYTSKDPPVGARIKVHAPQLGDGSDHDWHGYVGVVIAHKQWTLCRMDKKPRYWPSRDVYLNNFNLRLEQTQ